MQLHAGRHFREERDPRSCGANRIVTDRGQQTGKVKQSGVGKIAVRLMLL